jgi:hypothetical protein
MGAPADDDALGVDDDGADHRIGTGLPAPALGEAQRASHVERVGGV